MSTATVYALCERGQLPHYRVPNAIRVACADVDAWEPSAGLIVTIPAFHPQSVVRDRLAAVYHVRAP